MRRAMFGICALALAALVATQFVWAGPPAGPDGAHKVTICHKSGKIIVVDRKALAAHLAHGDCEAPGATKGADCDCCELSEDGASCDGDCFDDDLRCDTVAGECTCVDDAPPPPTLCEDSEDCDGDCPDGLECEPLDAGGCACNEPPPTTTLCEDSVPPNCDGDCDNPDETCVVVGECDKDPDEDVGECVGGPHPGDDCMFDFQCHACECQEPVVP